MLNFASYVKKIWQSLSLSSIKNAFVKAKIMTSEVETVNKMKDLMTEVTQAIEALNLSVGQEEL